MENLSKHKTVGKFVEGLGSAVEIEDAIDLRRSQGKRVCALERTMTRVGMGGKENTDGFEERSLCAGTIRRHRGCRWATASHSEK